MEASMEDDTTVAFDIGPAPTKRVQDKRAQGKSVSSTSSEEEDVNEEDRSEFDAAEEGGGNQQDGTGTAEAPVKWLEEKIVDKILGVKNITPENGEQPMYYIKWKHKSYLHCTWETQSDLEIMDTNVKSKIRRYLQTPQDNVNVPADEEDGDTVYFNVDYVEVHRILSCDPPTAEHAHAKSEESLQQMLDAMPAEEGDIDREVWYYVKWRNLPYNECTWERAHSLRSKCADVMAFWNRQKIPKGFNYGTVTPSVHDYKKLEASPTYGGPDSGLTLRGYQLEGVNWLLWNWFHRRSCILADEMGLGKTIQTACFLQALRDQSKIKMRGPHLIIAPLSLIRQWESELAMWCPDVNCIVLHGNVDAREVLLQNEFYYQEPFSSKDDIKDAKKKHAFKFDVLLTTYEVVVRDLSLITRVNWKVLILDEGHRLKNPSSRAFEKLMSINREFCLLLTGTPLQNKTEELWSLLHFCNRNKFPKLDDFSKNFGDLKGSADVANLHSVLKPYLLRRIKEDVEKSLPPKEETIIEVTLTSIQKKYYRAVFEKNAEFLYRGAKASNGPCLMNVMMELRKCCNHPYLMNGVEERVLEDIEASGPVSSTESHADVVNRALIESSGKLVLLDKLLPRLQQEGHKVLIFSQMVRALNIIEDFIRYRGYSYERLDGSTKVQDRLTAIERFGKPSLNTFIMLLSTKAGGLGLNLTSADTVIIYDSDWNPQNDLQAQARAHRIGQTRRVVVYRLLTAKTYEMQMFHRASLKLGLDRAVLAQARREQQQKGNGDEQSRSSTDVLTVSEIDELLKKGAYDVFREDDSDIKEFMSADVDSILARSSTTVHYNKDDNSISGTLGKFSKASFVSADDTEDVDINDPDFWWKTMKIENKSANAESADAASAYNQIVIGPDGEPKVVRASLRKRKRTENWASSVASQQGNISNSSKKQIYYAESADYANDDDSGVDSSSEDEKPKKEKKKPKQRRIEIPEESGAKSKKTTALLATYDCKLPGNLSLAFPYPRHYSRQIQPPPKPKRSYSHRNLSETHHFSHVPAPVQLVQHSSVEWSPTARDRTVDLLLKFGFSRWEAIAKRMITNGKSDVGNRSTADIESLCRNIVMQCGLAAVKSDPNAQSNPHHTEFIRNAIQAAIQVQDSILAKEQEIYIPDVLLQPSFQKKLSTGRAIKALHRLDILNRVISIVISAVSSVQKAFPGQYISHPPAITIDQAVALIPESVLVKHIVTNSTRPPWLYVCDWWDGQCDAALILGTFKHGFSSYDDMGVDPVLCFTSKIKSAYLMHRAVAEGEEGSIGNTRGSSKANRIVRSVEPAVSILRLDDTKRCRIVIPVRRPTEFVGVSSHPGSFSWVAFITNADGSGRETTEVLGYFEDEVEAARAYDKVVRMRIATRVDQGVNFDLNGARTELRAKSDVVPPILPWFHSSIFYGVRSAGTKWQAKIGYEGQLRHVGTFATDIEAAVVHDRFALGHAQHTSVKINFRSESDLRAALSKFSSRGDIKMSFFEVPADSASAMLDPNSLLAVSPLPPSLAAASEQESGFPIKPENMAAVETPIISAQGSGAITEMVFIANVGDVSTGDLTSLPLEVVVPSNKLIGTSEDCYSKTVMMQIAQEFEIAPMSEQGIENIDMSTEVHLDRSTDPLVAMSEVVAASTLTHSVSSGSIASKADEGGDDTISSGMPDSRTLNRLLTYLLSVSDAVKEEKPPLAMSTSAVRKQQAVEKNQKKIESAALMHQQHAAHRLKQQDTLGRKMPSYDNVKDKTDYLRDLIRNGKVQAPSNYKMTASIMNGTITDAGIVDTNSTLANIRSLTPEPTTSQRGWLGKGFNASKPYPHDPELNDLDSQSREAVLRMVARGRMGLRRDEVSLLENVSITNPQCMTLAIREGLLKRCEQSIDGPALSPEAYNQGIIDLENSNAPLSFPYVRVIVDGASDSKEDSSIEYVLRDDERMRLVSFFILHGAPPFNQHRYEPDVFPQVYETDHALDKKYAPDSCPQLPIDVIQALGVEVLPELQSRQQQNIMSWNSVKIAAGSTLRAGEIRWFYEEIWLPFCDSMTRMLSRGAEANRGPECSQLPNPFQPPPAYCLATRGLVETFLLRQKILYAIRFLLWNRLPSLVDYLKNGLPSGGTSFPSWWCSHIHDLGLLVGFLKHGYLAMTFIRADNALPFTQASIEKRVASTESGEDSGNCGDISLFPDNKDVEQRLISIVTEMTKDLPNLHVANLASIFVHGMGHQDTNAPRIVSNQIAGSARRKKRVLEDDKSAEILISSSSYLPPSLPESRQQNLQQIPGYSRFNIQQHLQQQALASMPQRYSSQQQGMSSRGPMGIHPQMHHHQGMGSGGPGMGGYNPAMQMNYQQMQQVPAGSPPVLPHQHVPGVSPLDLNGQNSLVQQNDPSNQSQSSMYLQQQQFQGGNPHSFYMMQQQQQQQNQAAMRQHQAMQAMMMQQRHYPGMQSQHRFTPQGMGGMGPRGGYVPPGMDINLIAMQQSFRDPTGQSSTQVPPYPQQQQHGFPPQMQNPAMFGPGFSRPPQR